MIASCHPCPRDKKLIEKYIRFVEGEDSTIEYHFVLTGGFNLRGISVNGKFYSYVADVIEMARNQFSKKRV